MFVMTTNGADKFLFRKLQRTWLDLKRGALHVQKNLKLDLFYYIQFILHHWRDCFLERIQYSKRACYNGKKKVRKKAKIRIITTVMTRLSKAKHIFKNWSKQETARFILRERISVSSEEERIIKVEVKTQSHRKNPVPPIGFSFHLRDWILHISIP